MTTAILQRNKMRGTLSRISEDDIVWFPDDTVSLVAKNYDGSLWLHQLYPPVPPTTPARPLPSTGSDMLYEILGSANVEYEHHIPMAMLDRPGSWRTLARSALDGGNFFSTIGYANDVLEDGIDDGISTEVEYDYREFNREALRYTHSIDFVFFEFFFPYREDKSLHYGFKLSTSKWILADDGSVSSLSEADNYNLHLDAEGGPMYSRYFHPLEDISELPSFVTEGQTIENALAITKIWGAEDTPPLAPYAVTKLKSVAAGDHSLPLIWDSEKGIAWR